MKEKLAYLRLNECNIFDLLEAKEIFSKEYSIDINVYFKEDHPFEQYFELLKAQGIDILF